MSEPRRSRRDQALDAGHAEAEQVMERGRRLRAHVEANPGKFPLVEKFGIRAEAFGDGDPDAELAQANLDLTIDVPEVTDP